MRSTISVFCVLAFLANTAFAIDVYSDRASWEAALGKVTSVIEDLNSVAPFVFTDGQELVTKKITIKRDGGANGGAGDLQIEPGSEFGNLDGTAFLSGETGMEPHESTTISFAGRSAFAFGADFFSPFSGDGIGLLVQNETFLLDGIPGFEQGFFGVVSDTPFNVVSIVGSVDTISFQELWSADNLSYAVVVPEPKCLALFVIALCSALGFTRRR